MSALKSGETVGCCALAEEEGREMIWERMFGFEGAMKHR